MQYIYIKLSNNFVTDKLLNYLQNYFNNIIFLDTKSNPNKEDILVSDAIYLQNNYQQLKNTNVVLLCDNDEKLNIDRKKFFYISFLEIPLKIQDLIDLIESMKIMISNIYKYNNHFLDLNSGVLYNDSSTLILSEKELLILKEFFILPKQNIAKSHFMKAVWNIANEDIESQSLENYISTLRRKFNEVNISLSILKNKDGYQLI